VTAIEAGEVREAPATRALRAFRARYGRLLEWWVGALMVVLFVEVTAGVAFRALGHSLIWYDEVASVLLAWLTYYGSALASVKRAHIGCPELVDALPWGPRRLVNVLAQVVVIVFFSVLGWVGVSIMPVLSGDTMVSLSWVPMNFVQSVIPVSAALIVVAELTHLVDLVVATGPPAVAAARATLADGLH
jgi:TRAP-type C4-dicarboxylate transport system permease small subunit